MDSNPTIPRTEAECSTNYAMVAVPTRLSLAVYITNNFFILTLARLGVINLATAQPGRGQGLQPGPNVIKLFTVVIYTCS